MVHLEKFKIIGFKDPARYAEVVFSEEAVSVIYGENGSGKTSLLKAISAFLSQDHTALAAMSIKEVICSFKHEGVSREISVAKEDTDISYNWTSFIDSPLKETRSLALGVDRGVSTQSIRIDPDLIYDFIRQSSMARRFFDKSNAVSAKQFSEEFSHYLRFRQHHLRDKRVEVDFLSAHENLQNIKLENIEEILLNHYKKAKYTANLKIQSALFTTLADAIDDDTTKSQHSVNEDFYSKIVNHKTRMIEALTDDDSNQTNSVKKRILKTLQALTEDNYLTEIEHKPLLLKLFLNMIDELERERLALGSIYLLIDTFNKYLIEDKKLVINNSEIYVSVGKQSHSIHDLSSGERHMLTFLCLVLFQGRDRDFLIIDEPEISLNILWQRELLGLFNQLIPNTQIIVASHSPILAKRSPNFLTPLLTGTVANA
ncbi:AAA family ATPase [Undibacterium sp. Ji42W]|uniref:AAA family ATPase n=1 Tax=Undibacterium sp. Ji42W TaxID=3413039 RepID=UPI003BF38652